jgi:hypothetical protein
VERSRQGRRVEEVAASAANAARSMSERAYGFPDANQPATPSSLSAFSIRFLVDSSIFSDSALR